MDALDRALLNTIQKHFPIAVNPYQNLAATVGTTEADAYERIQRLRKDGIIRRLGGVFDSRRLGYYSTLCTAKIPAEKIPLLTDLLAEIPGVTHNYIRNHEYNCWFTLIARSETVAERIIQTIREKLGIADVFNLPATRIFKINVNFDLSEEDTSSDDEVDSSEEINMIGSSEKSISPHELTDRDIALIQVLQGNLPDSKTPFVELAKSLQWSVDDVISCIQGLLDADVMRRMGAILRHQKAGFVANAMGVWQVESEKAAEVGKIMACFKEVSHCYQRPTLPDWPYNLFTMIHGRTKEDCADVMKRISLATGITKYSMLFSVAELKKSSMQYFLEDENN